VGGGGGGAAGLPLKKISPRLASKGKARSSEKVFARRMRSKSDLIYLDELGGAETHQKKKIIKGELKSLEVAF